MFKIFNNFYVTHAVNDNPFIATSLISVLAERGVITFRVEVKHIRFPCLSFSHGSGVFQKLIRAHESVLDSRWM